MAVRKQSDQQPFDHVFLSDDDLAYLHVQKVDKSALALNSFVQFFDVCRHIHYLRVPE